MSQRTIPLASFDPLYLSHPKIRAAGGAGAVVNFSAILYSTAHLTDGFVPSDALDALVVPFSGLMVESLHALEGIPIPLARAVGEISGRLTDAGLWRLTDGGFEIHDFERYQITRSKLEKQRAQKTARQSRWRRNASTARLPSTSQRSSVVSEPTATAQFSGELGLDKMKTPNSGPPKDTLGGAVAEIPGASGRTLAAVSTVIRKWQLPEAALHCALEEMRDAGAQIRNRPAFVVAKLEQYGSEGRYAR